MTHSDKLDQVFSAVDAANAADPNTVEVDGKLVPAALVYGQRMTATLEKFQPDASEELQIAIRGQHIERFSIPRETYPEGKAGYYRWRNELKKRHAIRLGEIMREMGYGEESIERVGRIVRKEKPQTDPKSQTLEDIASLVFLEFELDAFLAKYGSYAPEKLADILAKTWRKMSENGHEAALKLDLPQGVVDLLHQGLAALDTPS